MKTITKSLLAGALLFATMSANATLFDFSGINAFGESGAQPLSFLEDGVSMKVYGYTMGADNAVGGGDDVAAYAYLDAFTGGLGVCSAGLSDVERAGIIFKNQCSVASDDNVTTNEYLKFVFAGPMEIRSISFNNNHDGGFGINDYIDIGGTLFGVAEPAPSIVLDAFSGTKQTMFTVAYYNTQFYVQSIDVPEPAGLALLGLGLLGFGAARRTRG